MDAPHYGGCGRSSSWIPAEALRARRMNNAGAGSRREAVHSRLHEHLTELLHGLKWRPPMRRALAGARLREDPARESRGQRDRRSPDLRTHRPRTRSPCSQPRVGLFVPQRGVFLSFKSHLCN